jgi:hypothetical protein
MRILDRFACLVAFIISAGEVARFWGDERFVPLAFDELLIAAALLWAAWRSRMDGAGWHLAAWSALCSFALVLLVDTAGHQMHGPAKAAGPIYLAVLSSMFLLGLWAARRSFALLRAERR